MSDLEGFVRRKLAKGFSEKEIVQLLAEEIGNYKDVDSQTAEKLAKAVISEVKKTQIKPKSDFVKDVLEYPCSGISMHDMGVGCRGDGDFYVHRKIGKLASIGAPAYLLPDEQDDAGAVEHEDKVVVVSVDGTHSRLSDFPFLAGFHVARAALRDVLVNGAKPVALLDDLHLADDGDLGKLFDFVAGASAVSELSKVPLVAGSTLRVGGDMVVGDRMVSCVGAVGISKSKNLITARRRIKAGDLILMTKGAGGGTICTTAIYSGNPDAVLETLNIDFIKACNAILDSAVLPKIHAMTDVTNGGLRGDANEICNTAKVGLRFDERKVKSMVNKKILQLLESQGVDYLGVSLDSLLVFTPEENAESVLKTVRKTGAEIEVIGEAVENPKCAVIVKDGKETPMKPLFRESAYTEIKKCVGEKTPEELSEMKEKIDSAFRRALEKRAKILKHIRNR